MNEIIFNEFFFFVSTEPTHVHGKTIITICRNIPLLFMIIYLKWWRKSMKRIQINNKNNNNNHFINQYAGNKYLLTIETMNEIFFFFYQLLLLFSVSDSVIRNAWSAKWMSTIEKRKIMKRKMKRNCWTHFMCFGRFLLCLCVILIFSILSVIQSLVSFMLRSTDDFFLLYFDSHSEES